MPASRPKIKINYQQAKVDTTAYAMKVVSDVARRFEDTFLRQEGLSVEVIAIDAGKATPCTKNTADNAKVRVKETTRLRDMRLICLDERQDW
jgi:hypothetical protein